MESENKISNGVKILICTGIYPPDSGGPATYSKILYDELPKYGVMAEVLSFGEVRRLPKIIRHFVYFAKVLSVGRKADIIFSQDPVSVGLPSCFAAKILRKKFILKIVGDYAWEQGSQRFGVKDLLDDFAHKKYGWQVELLRKIQKFVADNAETIIAPSEYFKKIISSWGVSSDKIRVVYNSFEAPGFDISKEEARVKINLSGTILISIGRLVPWKGFGILIEITPEILKQIPDAKLFIIDDGPEFQNLKSQISNLKLKNNVFLIGKISHDAALLYLLAGDIFILNTGYEGFSHLLLEAMAMGIPVITTKVGGNLEIIKNNENGILVEYNNKKELAAAVIKLYQDRELRERLVGAAKETVRGFNKEKMIKEIIEVLKL